MNNILAACLLSSLIACTLDDPYMPVNPEEKPAPPVVTEYQPIALTIGANGRFDVSGSSVKIGSANFVFLFAHLNVFRIISEVFQ